MFFVKKKTAYVLRISDWSSDVCSSDLLSTSGVRVNAVCPCLTETGMTKPTFDYAKAKEVTHKLGQLNPLRRAAQPEELANVALFLARDQASYVNGQAIAVAGGLPSSHPVTRQLLGQTSHRSEEHTSEPQSLMHISYAVF